jgi:FdhE protein
LFRRRRPVRKLAPAATRGPANVTREVRPLSEPHTPLSHPPVHIGEAARPPVALAPDPTRLFAERAARFRTLAQAHPLSVYLNFLASIAQAQHDIQAGLPEPTPPSAEAMERAIAHGMAPIQRDTVPIDATVTTTLERLFDALRPVAMPGPAAAALAGVVAAPQDEARAMIANVLADSLSVSELAEHIFVAAGLQTHFARLAARLPVERLQLVADGACPACGGPPVASAVVGFEGAHGARYVSCACCATRWNVVRIKCVACSSTKGVGYMHLDGAPDTLKAECCEVCRSYLKILYQTKDHTLDPVADDVASAGLDLMVREKGYRRAGFNVFLAGL